MVALIADRLGSTLDQVNLLVHTGASHDLYHSASSLSVLVLAFPEHKGAHSCHGHSLVQNDYKIRRSQYLCDPDQLTFQLEEAGSNIINRQILTNCWQYCDRLVFIAANIWSITNRGFFSIIISGR